MSTREDLARTLCGAAGKVNWTDTIPAVYYDQADALMDQWAFLNAGTPEPEPDAEPVNGEAPAEPPSSPYDDLRFYVAGIVGAGFPNESPRQIAQNALTVDETVRELLDTLLAEQQVAWEDRLAASEAVSAQHLSDAWQAGKIAGRGPGKPRDPYRRRNGD